MNIIAQYDSSVQNAPAGYKTAVNAAIAFIDRMILDPITVTLTFSFGAIQGQALDSNALGESSTNGYIESYGVLASQLAASARSAADIASVNSLPTADPLNGDSFWVSDFLAKVFGVGSDPHFTDPQDGFVALSSSYNFTFDPTHRAVAGAFDAIGVLEHEITEALGRISYLGQATFQHQPLYAPYDLFRNSGEGVRSLRQGAAVLAHRPAGDGRARLPHGRSSGQGFHERGPFGLHHPERIRRGGRRGCRGRRNGELYAGGRSGTIVLKNPIFAFRPEKSGPWAGFSKANAGDGSFSVFAMGGNASATT